MGRRRGNKGMYTSTLDYWYKKGCEFSFSLNCSCGNNMEGIIGHGDKLDKLHCSSCGLVWEVNKPYKEGE
jgi:hypothetical protein